MRFEDYFSANMSDVTIIWMTWQEQNNSLELFFCCRKFQEEFTTDLHHRPPKRSNVHSLRQCMVVNFLVLLIICLVQGHYHHVIQLMYLQVDNFEVLLLRQFLVIFRIIAIIDGEFHSRRLRWRVRVVGFWQI